MTPDTAIALLTLGFLLIYLELNRPGWIIPGAIGLTMTLFSLDALLRHGVRPTGFVLCSTATLLLLLGLLRATTPFLAAAATFALILGFYCFTSAPTAVHILTAVLCGLILGVGTSILTRIARRARTNKGLD